MEESDDGKEGMMLLGYDRTEKAKKLDILIHS